MLPAFEERKFVVSCVRLVSSMPESWPSGVLITLLTCPTVHAGVIGVFTVAPGLALAAPMPRNRPRPSPMAPTFFISTRVPCPRKTAHMPPSAASMMMMNGIMKSATVRAVYILPANVLTMGPKELSSPLAPALDMPTIHAAAPHSSLPSDRKMPSTLRGMLVNRLVICSISPSERLDSPPARSAQRSTGRFGPIFCNPPMATISDIVKLLRVQMAICDGAMRLDRRIRR
ncbi:MAG: hypothetical protein LKF93_02745 [Bifidobacterium tibiigranuli]|nr:hypothetical protein [Bifidobacterium tibiigranuli]